LPSLGVQALACAVSLCRVVGWHGHAPLQGHGRCLRSESRLWPAPCLCGRGLFSVFICVHPWPRSPLGGHARSPATGPQHSESRRPGDGHAGSRSPPRMKPNEKQYHRPLGLLIPADVLLARSHCSHIPRVCYFPHPGAAFGASDPRYTPAASLSDNLLCAAPTVLPAGTPIARVFPDAGTDLVAQTLSYYRSDPLSGGGYVLAQNCPRA
jgi:hypothetical protein